MPLEFIPIATKILFPPRDDIFALLSGDGFSPADGDLLCIASKCLAIHQGRCVRIDGADRAELAAAEADRVIDGSSLCVKDGALIAYAGIDESNGNGYYVLWPKNVTELLMEIHGFLCEKFCMKRLGLISVDSRLEPMRFGTSGIAQGLFGFNPLNDCRGNRDIFGRQLLVTTVNVADAIASTACYLMGEGAECRPLVLVRGAKNVEFGENFSLKDLIIPKEEDIFSGVLTL